MAIERVEERRGVHVAQRPPTADHRVGAGLEEGAGEAEHAFAAQDSSGGGVTRRQHHDATVEVERLDLSRLQQAVFHGVAWSKQDRGALRVRLVGHGVRREMQDVVGSQIARLQRLLGGALADECFHAADVPLDRTAFLSRVRKPTESKALEERGILVTAPRSPRLRREPDRPASTSCQPAPSAQSPATAATAWQRVPAPARTAPRGAAPPAWLSALRTGGDGGRHRPR